MGYSAGQVLGPLVVAPLLGHGYHQALLLGSLIVAGAGLAAAVLQVRSPHDLAPNAETTPKAGTR